MNILQNGVAVVDGDTHHGVWCAEQGLVHDKWFAGEITKHLKPGDVAIDCGANIGTLTRAMLDAGAYVVAIDANHAALECLQKNCGGERVFILRAAVSDLPGVIRVVPDINAGASYCAEVEEGEVLAENTATVAAIALDDLDVGDPVVIKLDVEGYEVKALRGARNLIRRCRPVLIVEVNPSALQRAGDSEAALLAIIEELGYEWKIMQPQCKRGDEQYDVECIHKNPVDLFTEVP